MPGRSTSFQAPSFVGKSISEPIIVLCSTRRPSFWMQQMSKETANPALAFAADVTQEESISNLVKTAAGRLGTIDNHVAAYHSLILAPES